MRYQDHIELYNICDLVEQDGQTYYSRIPQSVRLHLNPKAQQAALRNSGCELRFNLKSDTAVITLKNLVDEPTLVEVWQGPIYCSTQVVGTEATVIEVDRNPRHPVVTQRVAAEGLPFDPALIRVLCHTNTSLEILKVEGEFLPPRPEQSPDLVQLSYGSSITQGASAQGPSGLYTRHAADLVGADLINLGFGGSCHCEKAIADYIANRKDWNYCTLELGINMIGNFEVTEFRERVEYLISTVASNNPDKWVFCIDMFTHRWDFSDDPERHDICAAFRGTVASVVKGIGFDHVVHLNGRELIGSGITALKNDALHPSPRGMARIAENLANVISKHLNASR